NRMRHCEEAERWPEGFVVLGDAACVFNPVYGQGMTTAALGVLALKRCLEEHRRHHPDGGLLGFARDFQARLARVNVIPWLFATSEDARFRETEGVRPGWTTWLVGHYVDRVLRLSTKRAAVRKRWLEVVHMLRAPWSLLHPRVLFPLLTRAAAL